MIRELASAEHRTQLSAPHSTPMILVRAVAVLALISSVAVGQTGHVAGRVVDKLAGVALPFSGVSIVGQSADRLTSDSGAFQLEAAPGTIHLRIRHVGFTPVDTQLVVRANDTTRVTIELARIPVTLAAMRVTDAPCRLAGRADRRRRRAAAGLRAIAAERRAISTRQLAVPVQLRRRTTVQPSRRGTEEPERNPTSRLRSWTRWRS